MLGKCEWGKDSAEACRNKLEMVYACLGIVLIVLDSADLRRNWVGVWGVIGENCI